MSGQRALDQGMVDACTPPSGRYGPPRPRKWQSVLATGSSGTPPPTKTVPDYSLARIIGSSRGVKRTGCGAVGHPGDSSR